MPGIGQRKSATFRISDAVSFAVISKVFPVSKIQEVLIATEKQSARHRLLPASVVIYYVIAFGLFLQSSSREVLRQLLEGLRYLLPKGELPKIACKSAISQARTKLGIAPLETLYQQVVRPIANDKTQGARFRDWTLMTIDGTAFDLADTPENAEAFGYPQGGRGTPAFPKLRAVTLIENGTHVICDIAYDAFAVSEHKLAARLIPRLRPGMLVLADRLYSNYALWETACQTGADLVWRIRKNSVLKPTRKLSDGSYISKLYPSEKDKRHDTKGVEVRVIDYEVTGANEPVYRLITTILDPEAAPAEELAVLYHQRWTIETVLREMKVHLSNGPVMLRSRKPELAIQELYGILLAHFAVRGVMHEAATYAGIEPDQLSFTHSLRVIRRRIQSSSAFSPSAPEANSRGDYARNSRGENSTAAQPTQPEGSEEKNERISDTSKSRDDTHQRDANYH